MAMGPAFPARLPLLTASAFLVLAAAACGGESGAHEGDGGNGGSGGSGNAASTIVAAWEGVSGPKEYCSVFCDNGRAVADDNAASCLELSTSFYMAYEVQGDEVVYSDDQGEVLRRPFVLTASELTMMVDAYAVTFQRAGDSHPLCSDETLPIRQRGQ